MHIKYTAHASEYELATGVVSNMTSVEVLAYSYKQVLALFDSMAA